MYFLKISVSCKQIIVGGLYIIVELRLEKKQKKDSHA